jgi:transposase-like protein
MPNSYFTITPTSTSIEAESRRSHNCKRYCQVKPEFGKLHTLWRAIDQDGDTIDIPVQKRR